VAPPGAGCEVGAARILGLDPGSRHTGFGIVDCHGASTVYVTSGAISTPDGTLPIRLQAIFERVRALVEEYRPAEIAIERVFVKRNPDSALKLGQARGAALCGAFTGAAAVFEYSPREIKMAIVGAGGAEKRQVQHMVKALLQLDARLKADAADALAVALCHAHGRTLRARLGAHL
jgi:crossover junction endodeoxyribonuclease RuvC